MSKTTEEALPTSRRHAWPQSTFSNLEKKGGRRVPQIEKDIEGVEKKKDRGNTANRGKPAFEEG